MPDHVHLIVQGMNDKAHLPRFVQRGKQLSGYHFRKRGKLWQTGYYEHVIRPNDDTDRVIGYVLQNPVAAGIVEKAEDYPFSGRCESPDTVGPTFQVGRDEDAPDP